MKIYVGNLSFKVEDGELRASFEAHGEVESANVIKDRESGRSRGFGFVSMPNDDEARAAIEAINGQEIAGREVKVNEARPQEDRPRGGGGGGFRGRRNGGGGGGGFRGGRREGSRPPRDQF